MRGLASRENNDDSLFRRSPCLNSTFFDAPERRRKEGA